ncbi:MAG: hypothetical protein ACRDYD_09550 [Acidimicrobiales bacterium]
MFRRKMQRPPEPQVTHNFRVLATAEEKAAAAARAAERDEVIAQSLSRRQRLYREATEPAVRLVRTDGGDAPSQVS